MSVPATPIATLVADASADHRTRDTAVRSALYAAVALSGFAGGLVVAAGYVTSAAVVAGALAAVLLAAAAATLLARASDAATALPTAPPPTAAAAVATPPVMVPDVAARPAATRPTIRDRVTGLYSAAFVEDAIERDVRRARRARGAVAVVLADIDHFHGFAADLGGTAAEQVLVQVGRFLEEGIRTSDVAANRGGDAFALLLAGADAADAVMRMEELRHRLRDQAPVQVDGIPFPLTMSFGVAAYPEHGESAADLLAAAEEALEAARRLGRNRVVAARAASR